MTSTPPTTAAASKGPGFAEFVCLIAVMMAMNALAIDAKRWEVWDRVFTPDAHIDYPGQVWPSLQAWRDDFAPAHDNYDVTQHIITNVSWHVSGDSGNALSYSHFHLIRHEQPEHHVVTGGAWYDDTLRRTEAGWRISRRTCRVTWITGSPGFEVEEMSKYLSSMSKGASDGTLTFIDALGG